MDWQPVPLVGGAYNDDNRPWTAQDTVNWLPLRAERPGARADMILRTPPGLVQVADLGAPIRGAHNAEGRFFLVAGNTLKRLNPDFTATDIGTIGGVGRCSLAHNQIAGGNQLVVANGQSGYVHNTADGTFGIITDPGFPGARTVDYVDSYITFVEPFGRFWGHSDLADATAYNTLDRYEAESAPDRVVTHIVSHREVVVLGERSGEIFRNTGANTGTFARSDGTEMERGCAAPFAIARLDNTVYFLGNDGIVYRLNGYVPERISTSALEQAFAQRNIAQAFAMTWEDRGHKVFYLTFPDGETFGFDVASGEWHRRASFGLKRWRLNTLTYWNNAWYGGDYASGKVYRLDWGVANEGGAPMVSTRRSGVAHADGNQASVEGLKLVFDVGRSGVANTDHVCSVRYSDDGGHNFVDAYVRSIGGAGDYRRTVEIRRLGRTEQRIWEVEVSSPAQRDLIAASAMATRLKS